MTFLERHHRHPFHGGIYLPDLGRRPPLGPITPVGSEANLRLPLTLGPWGPMELMVDEGAPVQAGALLAKDRRGHTLRAPQTGVRGATTRVTVGGNEHCPAVWLHPAEGNIHSGETAAPPEQQVLAARMTSLAQTEAVLDLIEEAGLLMARTGASAAEVLREHRGERVDLVVANAAPLEAELNAPLAVLQAWPPEVFAGLAIIKTLLNARAAVAAYSERFPIDFSAAETWGVACLPLGESYPQALDRLVLTSVMRNKRYRPRRGKGALVFDVQLLRQVERIVLGGVWPTHRVVTVYGDAVVNPGQFLAPLGLSYEALLTNVTLRDDAATVLEGGSMTGWAVDPVEAVVSQRTEGLAVLRRRHRYRPERCIRCGWCLDDCPANLDPAQLVNKAELGRYDEAAELGVDQCVECGICAYVCPSHLPILEQIRVIKRNLPIERRRRRAKHS